MFKITYALLVKHCRQVGSGMEERGACILKLVAMPWCQSRMCFDCKILCVLL